MTTISCAVCPGPVELDVDRPTCLIGHDFDPDDLPVATQRAADRALWLAIRALEDATSAALWMLERPGIATGKPYLRDHVTTGREAAKMLRELIAGREGSDSDADHRPEQW
jgi:hypothetical protein